MKGSSWCEIIFVVTHGNPVMIRLHCDVWGLRIFNLLLTLRDADLNSVTFYMIYYYYYWLLCYCLLPWCKWQASSEIKLYQYIYIIYGRELGAIAIYDIHLKLQSGEISFTHNLLYWCENCFEILHSARQYHCRALCKIWKQFDDWNGCSGRTSFRKIWAWDALRTVILYCNSLPYTIFLSGLPQYRISVQHSS